MSLWGPDVTAEIVERYQVGETAPALAKNRSLGVSRQPDSRDFPDE
jgi:hypothetical protein